MPLCFCPSLAPLSHSLSISSFSVSPSPAISPCLPLSLCPHVFLCPAAPLCPFFTPGACCLHLSASPTSICLSLGSRPTQLSSLVSTHISASPGSTLGLSCTILDVRTGCQASCGNAMAMGLSSFPSLCTESRPWRRTRGPSVAPRTLTSPGNQGQEETWSRDCKILPWNLLEAEKTPIKVFQPLIFDFT